MPRDFSVFDTLDDGVQVISPSMVYLYLNRKLLAEIGMSKQDIIGQKMSEKFPGIEQTDVYQHIKLCWTSGKIYKLLNEFDFPDGRRTYHELKLERIPEGVLIFSRDITESKKGELLLKETNKNLDHFAHLAAHDLREPAKRMQILCEMLELDYSEYLPEEAKKICNKITAQADILLSLINDFRMLSKIGGGHKGAPTEFSILEEIKEVSNRYNDRFKDHSIEVTLPQKDVRINGYSSLAQILLDNLFSNVLTHGKEKLTIRIDPNTSPTKIYFENKTDHVPPKDLLLPFVTINEKLNTGLGLATVKRIIDYHNGELSARYHDGIFQISFTLGNL